ncbi:MAG: type II toxin-antitoxin system RelE/ParE family toxin [Bacteroidales bacterium]|nr:type II toxin-antitoxin system RelE/ParE family toxin [Bacteroidales bacterium]
MQINWSEQSRDDLREIVSYVGNSFGQRKAKEVFAEIRSSAELLKNFPMLGKSFVKDEELQIEYCTLPSKLNQLIYCVEDETINIIAVWQNRRDINGLKKMLSNNNGSEE